MSKSKGNVIDPLDLIDQYGADALRFTLAAMAAQGRDIKLSVAARRGLSQFRDQDLERRALCRDERLRPRRRLRSARREGDAQPLDARRGRQGVAEVTAGDRGLSLQRRGARRLSLRLERLLRLESRIRQARAAGADDSPAKAETRATIAFVLDEIAKLLHPFMPFLTEELWAIKGEDGPTRESVLGAGTMATARRPWTITRPEAEIGWVVDLVTEVRSVRSETNVPPAPRSRSCSSRPPVKRGNGSAAGATPSSVSRGFRRSPSATPLPRAPSS